MNQALSALLRAGVHASSAEIVPYYQDVYDHALRATERIDGLRDTIESILSTSLAMQGNALNEIMKKLTAWAAIIAIPTGVTGYFGQNIPFPGYRAAGLLAQHGAFAGFGHRTVGELQTPGMAVVEGSGAHPLRHTRAGKRIPLGVFMDEERKPPVQVYGFGPTDKRTSLVFGRVAARRQAGERYGFRRRVAHGTSTGTCAADPRCDRGSGCSRVREARLRAASVNAILEGSNATKGAMYFHFESKEELGRAVLAAALEKFKETTDRWTSRTDLDPFEILHGLIDQVAQMFLTDPIVRAEFRLIIEPDSMRTCRTVAHGCGGPRLAT